MVDRIPLTEETFAAPTARRRDPLTEKHFEGGVEFAPPVPPVPQAPPSVDKATDIAKAAAAQGTLGLAADVPGMFGDIGSLAKRYLPDVTKYTYGVSPAGVLGVMTAPSEVEAKRRAQEEAERVKESRRQEEAGLSIQTPFGVNVPTSRGLEQTITKFIPSLAYRGVTPEAQAVGKATRLGTSMLPGGGGLGAAAGRFGAGLTGSGFGQIASKIAEEGEAVSPEYRPYVEPIATMAGTVAPLVIGRRVADIAGATFTPSRVGEKKLIELMREDVNAGRASPEMLDTAVALNTPASVADIFGPKTKTGQYIAEQAGYATGPAREQAEQYAAIGKEAGTGVRERIPEAAARTVGILEDISGAPINAPALAELTQAANKQTRNGVYQIARSNPNAGSVDFRGLGLVNGTNTPLVSHPMIQKAMVDAAKTAASAPAEWGIVTPAFAETGQVTRSGNLSYWDQVKKELDREIKVAANPNTASYDPARVASLQNVRTQLVNQLDVIVPEYAQARNKALETFRADSAPEAGVEFYKVSNIFKRNDAINALNDLTPEARQMFSHGWMHGLSEEITKTPNGMMNVANKLTMPGSFQDNARMMLGDSFDAVRGKILSENMRNSASLKIKDAPGLMTPAAIGAVLMEAAIQAQLLAPEHLTAAVVGAGLGAAGGAAKRAVAHNVANAVIPLALSEDPRDLMRLSRMISESPQLGSLFSNMNAVLQASQQPREQRATGGRAVRGMTAQAMISAVERAKKKLQNDTKPILEQTDESVVKALEVANQHI